jgi:hypothetical protein
MRQSDSSLAAVLLGLAAIAGTAHAQLANVEMGDPPESIGGNPTPATQPNVAPPVELPAKEGEQPVNSGKLHFTLGFDMPTKYFFRGIMTKDRGFIIQPVASLAIDLYEHEKFKLAADLGTWNSFHGDTRGAGGTGFQRNWFESDLLAGITFKYDIFAFRTAYVTQMSPSNNFSTIDEVDFTFTLDDSGWMGKWALNPSVLFVQEVGEHGADGANRGGGSYLELGLTPGFDAEIPVIEKLRVNFPIVAGFGLSNYYENAAGADQGFGYFQVGTRLLIPLPVNRNYGQWTVSAGVHFLVLGDAARQFNTNREDFEVIGMLGLSVTY